jgi:hypothetical protein
VRSICEGFPYLGVAYVGVVGVVLAGIWGGGARTGGLSAPICGFWVVWEGSIVNLMTVSQSYVRGMKGSSRVFISHP